MVMLAGAALLCACSPGGKSGGQTGEDPKYAGLESQILAWRTEIKASHPACADRTSGKGCQDFEVACKGDEALSADDRAAGVTAKVVVAMTFTGWDSKQGDKPASAFADFRRIGPSWTRTEAKPVNLTTCAP
jgi:hypothetical protein